MAKKSMRTVKEHRQFLEQEAARVANPTAGFFGPGSMAWCLNREGVLGLVVLRALFLQVAHPAVAQGVADHSDFERHPFKRAFATFKAQQAIVFGTCDESIEALMAIYRRHAAVRGQVAGRRYEANDPALLFWVFATLIDSMFYAYRTFLPDLPAADWARFYEEGKRFARLIGITADQVPPTKAAFDAWMEKAIASDEIHVGAAGRAIGESLLTMPLRIGKPVTSFLAAGELPPKLREGFGLPWSAAQQRRYDRFAALVRWLAGHLPPFLHTAPTYWLALRRARRAATQ